MASVIGRVYVAWNLSNGKVYVGQTTQPLSIRWSIHCSDARLRAKTKFHRALRFYGPGAFKVMTLAEAHDMAELNTLEERWIAKLDACERDAGYNQIAGGLNYKRTDQAKANMSKAARVKPKVTDETRRRISAAGIGRKQSAQHIARRAAALRGRRPSPQCLRAVAEANRVRVYSEETRAKLRLATRKANEVRWGR